MTEPTAVAPAPGPQQIRTLAFALCASPIAIIVATAFALPGGDSWIDVRLALLVAVMVLVGFALAQVLGFRAPPIPAGSSGADVTAASLRTYTSLMFVRFALTEAPMIGAIALAFAFEQGAGVLLVALVAGLPALVAQTWPSARNVRLVADRLEAAGGRSGLRETFGV